MSTFPSQDQISSVTTKAALSSLVVTNFLEHATTVIDGNQVAFNQILVELLNTQGHGCNDSFRASFENMIAGAEFDMSRIEKRLSGECVFDMYVTDADGQGDYADVNMGNKVALIALKQSNYMLALLRLAEDQCLDAQLS